MLTRALELPAATWSSWSSCSPAAPPASWTAGSSTDAIKVPLVIDGITGVDASPSMPGSAFLMLYHMSGVTEIGRPAWGQVRGGMGGITAALASCARAAGATVRTSAPVSRILVRDGRAAGVVLESGEEVRAGTVVSAADPYTTFVRLLEPGDLPARARRAAEHRKFTGVAMKMHIALDRLPDVTGFEPGVGPQHHGTFLHRAHDGLPGGGVRGRQGGSSGALPAHRVHGAQRARPDRGARGRHRWGVYLQHAPYQLAEGSWDEVKEAYGDRVLECIEQYMPGITASVVGREVLTPVDLERRLGLTGGDLYHGAMTLDQLFLLRSGSGRSSHHTPVDGLFLAGSARTPAAASSACRAATAPGPCCGTCPDDPAGRGDAGARPRADRAAGHPAGLAVHPATGSSNEAEYDLYFRVVREDPGLLAWTRSCLRIDGELMEDLHRTGLSAEDRCDILQGLLTVHRVTLERWVTVGEAVEAAPAGRRRRDRRGADPEPGAGGPPLEGRPPRLPRAAGGHEHPAGPGGRAARRRAY